MATAEQVTSADECRAEDIIRMARFETRRDLTQRDMRDLLCRQMNWTGAKAQMVVASLCGVAS
jgi:hypothetical protein